MKVQGRVENVSFPPGGDVYLSVYQEGGNLEVILPWNLESLEVFIDGGRVVRPGSGYPQEKKEALFWLRNTPCTVEADMRNDGYATHAEFFSVK